MFVRMVRGSAVALLVTVALALTGCSISAGAEVASGFADATEDAYVPYEPALPEGTVTQSEDPVDWEVLPACPDYLTSGPADPWELVDGYPVDQMDAAGIVPECGYTWLSKNIEVDYPGVVSTVTDGSIYSLGGELTMAGWVLLSDDFSPTLGLAYWDYAGGRRYASPDGYTFGIEVYANGTTPDTYTAYFDLLEPQAPEPS